MHEIKLFYLPHCPYCKKTMNELKDLLNDSKYSSLNIRFIDEEKEKELANSYNYYYVPTIYIGDNKELEGKFTKEELEKTLIKAL